MLYQALVSLSGMLLQQLILFGMLAVFDSLGYISHISTSGLNQVFDCEHMAGLHLIGIWLCPNIEGVVDSGLSAPKPKGQCGFSGLI